MSGIGDHAGEMIYIMLSMVLIVLVISTSMILVRMSKKGTNKEIGEVEVALAEAHNDFYSDRENSVISGLQLKQLVRQSQDRDCALLIQTLSLVGNQKAWTAGSVSGVSECGVKTSTGSVTETTFTGLAFNDAKNKLLPVAQIDVKDGELGNHRYGANAGGGDDNATAAFPVKTALGSTVYNSCLVNYGTILKNSVTQSGTSGENYESVFQANSTGSGGSLLVCDWDDVSGVSGQTIAFKDGRFYTKQEFAMSQSGVPLRYDNTVDFGKPGSTMYIEDNAVFRSYTLMDLSGKYVGLVFIEQAHR